MIEKYYRYVDQLYSCGDDEYGFYTRLRVELREYEIAKYTLKGLWIWIFKLSLLDIYRKKRFWAWAT